MRKSILIFAFLIASISIVSGQGLGSPGTIKDDGEDMNEEVIKKSEGTTFGNNHIGEHKTLTR